MNVLSPFSLCVQCYDLSMHFSNSAAGLPSSCQLILTLNSDVEPTYHTKAFYSAFRF